MLRFFEQKPLTEVGAALGIDPDTAQKRVSRAVERLRRFFGQRGVAVSAGGLATALAAGAVQAAPTGLPAAALKTTASLAGTTTALISGTLKLMAWTNSKTAVTVGIGLLLAAGGATVSYRWSERPRPMADWQQAPISAAALDRAPRKLLIVPAAEAQRTENGARVGAGSVGDGRALAVNVSVHDIVTLPDGRALGQNQPVRDLVGLAHDIRNADQIVADTPLPAGDFDLLCNLPAGNPEALREALVKKFGVTGRRETRERDVLLLQVKPTPAPGLQPSTSGARGISSGLGRISIHGHPISVLVGSMKNWFGLPVLDRTGLNGRYDIDLQAGTPLSGKGDRELVKQAVLEQLGLEVVAAREPIEMLVIQKAK